MARRKVPAPTSTPPPGPERLRDLLDPSADPPDYPALFERLHGLATVVREELAARLGPALAVHLKTLSQGTYAEKQDLAKWVNGQLRQLGLAVRCPKTNRAAILLADHGPNPEKGRFQVQTVHDRKRTLSSVELPEFGLMPADLRQDHLRPERRKKK
jgi:hypothetical protein